MIKVFISDFWHVVLFPKDFQIRGSSTKLSKVVGMEYTLNEELLTFYSKIKKEYSLQLAIYSSGSLFKMPELQPFLTPIFDKGYSVSDIRFEKDNPDSFRFLAKQFNVQTSEMIFIDDTPDNLEAAVEAGVMTVHYRNNEQAIAEINDLL